ncbi:MAG: iron ABC transporter permease [Thermodesulfobacteriota bacterium]
MTRISRLEKIGNTLKQINVGFLIQFSVSLLVLFMVLYPIGWLWLGSIRTEPFAPDYTLSWYLKIFSDAVLWQRLTNTLKITIGTGILSLIIGLPIAWIVARTDTPFSKKFELIAVVPFMTAPLIGALAWTNLAAPRTGLLNLLYRFVFDSSLKHGPLNIYSMWGIIFCLGLYYSPYVFLFTAGALRSMDPALEEASRISGCNIIRTTFKITLPLVYPAITSGVLLAMVFAAGQFAVPALLGTPAQFSVMTTTIYELMNRWPINRSLAAAIGNLLVLFTFLLLYLRGKLLSKGAFTTVTGKGYRPDIIRLGKWKYVTFSFCLLYAIVVFGLPMFALIYSSLVKYWSVKIGLHRLGFWNYTYLFTEHSLTFVAIKNSLLLAVFGATACIFISSIISFIVHRGKSRWTPLLDYVAMMPIGVPGVVFAVGVLLGWIRPPFVLYGTLGILIVGYISRFNPVGIRAVSSSLVQVHPELEESSRVAGSSWAGTLLRITLPLVKPGMQAGWMTLFIVFLREFGISLFLYSPGNEVVSIMLYEFWENGDMMKASALSIVLMVVTVISIIIMRRLTGADIAGMKS